MDLLHIKGIILHQFIKGSPYRRIKHFLMPCRHTDQRNFLQSRIRKTVDKRAVRLGIERIRSRSYILLPNKQILYSERPVSLSRYGKNVSYRQVFFRIFIQESRILARIFEGDVNMSVVLLYLFQQQDDLAVLNPIFCIKLIAPRRLFSAMI